MRRRRRPHNHHLSTVMAFLILPILLFLSSADASPPASDIRLLLSFKAALPNPSVLPSWVPGADPCSSFVGVSCDGHDSGVVSVRLDSYPLKADFRHVVAYLLPLATLQLLSLRNTNLTGYISAASGARCGGELTQMDLSTNPMTGSLMDVAALASSCSGLKSLNVSSNSLAFVSNGARDKTQQPPPPPPPITFRIGLEDLDLSYNTISGDSALNWLFQSGAGLLRRLDLRGNAITGTVPIVQNCSGLEYLDLSSNSLWQIAGGGVGALSSCEKLTFLNLSSNHFAGELPSELLGSCRSLMLLDLSFNNFSGSVPPGLSSCSVLKSINLSNNNFSGDLPVETLTSMTSLEKLELGYNGISGKLMGSLVKLPNLQLLDFSANLLTGSIPTTLCDGPGLALQDLFLQNNQLTGSIPTAIGNCSKLRSLDLSFNYLTGTLPSSLGLLTQLRDLIVWENDLTGEIPDELRFLPDLESLFLDNNELTGSIPDGLENCTNLNWISLSSNRLTGSIPHWIGRLSKLAILKIGNNSLTGSIPGEIGDCKSLIWLDLNSNQLSGPIPATIGKQSGNIAGGLVAGKRYVYLRNDGSSECHGAGNLLEFSGIRQEGINRIPTRRSCNFTRIYMGSTQYTFRNNGSIIFLDLSYNQLDGEIPKEMGVMYYLNVLNLAHNSLSGVIPSELGNIGSVGILDLSHNQLEGPIPMSFARLTALSELDLSNNRLNGTIPDVNQLATFPAARYENNSGLCGFPLPTCGQNGSLAEGQNQRSRRRQPSLAGSVTVGLLVSLLIIIASLVFLLEYRKRQKKKKSADDGEARDVYVDSWSISGFANASRWKFTSPKEALSISLAAFEKPLQKLTFADLLEATNGFHDDCLVGSGGFGDVYRAELKDGSVVAIKKLIHVSSQGDKEFTAEMETIGRIKHRNLVPLLGYCKVKEERLLVYEYMKFGSLEDVLHDRKKTGIKLNWSARRKIAVGAARGLAFLHHSCIPHIIHRDMKSSNVLLDDELEARVSDFGMARPMNAMETHLSVSTLAGTPGYVPPEYYQSFRCSTKGDVYSYGVVLLELLTGKRPTDSSDFGDNVNLVDWVKQHSRLRITDVFDREMVKDDPGLELELLQHLKVACACLDERPARRPTMLNVMAMLKEIQAGSTLDSSAVVSASTNSVGGSFGSMEMGCLEEGKEEKEY